MATHSQKKIMADVTTIQSQCSVTCGADVAICDVLPYMMSLFEEEL